jgi:hypothetical protein
MQDTLALALSLALAHPMVGAPSDSVAAVNDTARAAPLVSLAPAMERLSWQPWSLPDPSLGSDSVHRTAHLGSADDIEYSEGHYKRLGLHRAASYAILPMFVAMYITGRKRLDHRATNDPPGWARLHGPLAAGVGSLFVFNTVTGIWNLHDMRKDPEHRTRRYIHTISMLAAEAGFTTAGIIGARSDRSQRGPHRAIGLASMGVATASSLVMLFWRD